MPHDSPLPRVHTLGSDKGRMQHNELMDLVTKLSDKVVALETDLTQTKKVYGAAFTKLIKKVKRLEKKDKLNKSRRKLRLMGVSTASTDFTTVNVPVTTAGAEISTVSLEVKTVGVYVDDIAAESLVYIRRSAAKTKDKEEFDKEERQRIARIHEVARYFYEVEWEDIRARLEASEDYYETTDRVKYKSTKVEVLKELQKKNWSTKLLQKQKVDKLSQKRYSIDDHSSEERMI
ncbi:hypothetical protein Tco_1212507 [Tanacetum coccineum]